MSIKKICLLIPSLGPGGMQRVMNVLANYFANLDELEVHLILYGISKDVFYPLNPKVKFHVPSFNFNNNKRFYYSIKTMFFIRSKVNSLKPDKILSFGEFWNSFILISLIGLSYPVYVSDRCQPDKSLGSIHNWLRRKLYPHAKGIIVQTKTARNIYAKIIKHPNIEVIGNPIPELVDTLLNEKENIVLTVGRLISTKHHDLLIDFFLESYQPGWKLVIAGGDVVNGNRMKDLTEKIRKLNAEDKVVLLGNVDKVADYYRRSKIFAFTSSSEGFPNVIGEAMAAGLAVVAFDCVAGPSDMIENGRTGYLIPLFNEQEFVGKLSELMRNEELRLMMGKASKEKIRQFSTERVAQKYFNFMMS